MEIPQEFERLFDVDWREAAVFGGRFSMKSHTVARYLLIRARQERTRILCAREFQNSIADSSHQLLSDLIAEYDLRDFVVTDKSIVNKINGSDFLFKGLRHNEQSVKSLEGIDIAWVEEAQTISKESIEVLTPTIRKPGSQIIYTYNRLLEDDPVHQRLVIEGRPNTIIINVNYDIALKYGVMPDVIKNEMEDDKANRPSLYKHKWLGEPSSMERKIYKDWKFIDAVPHEARLERYGLDFGYTNDPTAIVAVYYYNGGYILDEIAYQKGLSNKQIADILNGVPKAPVIADSAEPKSIDEIRAHGVTILPTVKGSDSVKQGIQFVQRQRISVTNRSFNIIDEYKRYMWMEDKDGKIINKPEHQWSHCFVGDTKIAMGDGSYKNISDVAVGDTVMTGHGERMVMKVFDNGEKNVSKYWLHTDTCSCTITATETHSVRTGQTWTPISQLKPGMEINVIRSFKEKSIGSTKGRDILRVLVKDFIGLFTSFISDLYLKAFMYNIKMVTPTTIGQKTLSYSPLNHTFYIMGKRTPIGFVHTYSHSGWSLPKTGTQAKMVQSGIQNMVKKLGEIVSIKNTHAKNVQKSSNQDTVGLLSFATTTAKLEHLEREGEWKERVYDLMIEDNHEYFTNGVLVHNSMDAIRYSFDGLQPREDDVKRIMRMHMARRHNNNANAL